MDRQIGLAWAGGSAGDQGREAVPCAACQSFSLAPEQLPALPDQLAGTKVLIRRAPGTSAGVWAAAIREIHRRGGLPGVHLTGVPLEDDPALDAEGHDLIVDVGDGDPDRVAFDLKRALALARGRHPATLLAIAATPGTTEELRQRGMASYVDRFLPVTTSIDGPGDLLTPIAPDDLRVWRLPDEVDAARAILRLAATLQPWLPAGLVPVEGRALKCGEDRPLHPFLNPQTLDLVAVSRSCPAPAMVTSDVPGVVAERMEVGAASVFRARVAGGDRFAAGVDVAAARALSIEEIIARHQAAAARQAAETATTIASGSLTLTFEAPGFAAPVTITSQTTIYTDRRPGTADQGLRDEERIDLQQRDIRVNGVLFTARGGVPRLPIIEPERAAAPPLTITLSDLYRYRLVARDSLRGRDCYVVAFVPRDRGAALYEGRAWIDASSFGMARVAAAQTGLKGPITASEQVDEFTVEASGRWRLLRSNVHQTYEGASMRTPIHRLLIIDRDEVNAADFAARRAAAYASPDVILRDTPQGYRYLKKPDAVRSPANGPPPAPGDTPSTERVVAGRADRIRTFAFGVIVDPNITQPLPFAGLSYVDFNLFGTGTQFSGFFGGSYGQLAFSAPSIRGTRWQLAGRAFGIVTSYNDRAFENGRERSTLDIRQRPAQAAVWVLRPVTARSALRLEYDWDYTKFDPAPETGATFVVPQNQNAHALRVGLDLQRAGWQASVWGSYARRIGWRPWGEAEAPVLGLVEYKPEHADYERYGASLFRSQAITPRLTTRIEAAVMGGSDLDRFSRFAFGTFDNRLHGYPSALVRYNRGGVLRTALAWTAAPALRLDLFADTAGVHDPGFGPGLRNFTGFGAGVEAPAPFGTLLAVEWGFGLQGVNSKGNQGTHVVRISGYKIF